MADLIFSHPRVDKLVGPLTVSTGADKIQWGYGLNHMTYPTYGGEVVQILSCYIDDLVVEGTAHNYREMEQIYGWFLNYVQVASQGQTDGLYHYSDEPVTCEYPERGWKFTIKPYQLPGYRMATDLVAPSWKIVARMVEPDGGMTALTMQTVQSARGDLTAFGHMNAGIGFTEDNPFSNPFPKKRDTGLKEATGKALDELGDYFVSLIPAYADGDVSSLFGSGLPAFLNPDRQGPSNETSTTSATPRRGNQNSNNSNSSSDTDTTATASAVNRVADRSGPASRRGQQVTSYPLSKVGYFNGGPGVGTHNFSAPPSGWQNDNAVDLNTPIGTRVFAVEDATVTKVAKGAQGTAGQGYQVTLDTGGRKWFYGHLSKCFVSEGDHVQAADCIGRSGWSGRAHLHIACDTGNPMKLLGIS